MRSVRVSHRRIKIFDSIYSVASAVFLMILFALLNSHRVYSTLRSSERDRIRNALTYYLSTLPDSEKTSPISSVRMINFIQTNQQLYETIDQYVKTLSPATSRHQKLKIPISYRSFQNMLKSAAEKAHVKYRSLSAKAYQNTIIQIMRDSRMINLTAQVLKDASQDEPIPDPSPSPSSTPSFLMIKPIVRNPATPSEKSGWKIAPESKRIQDQIKKLNSRNRKLYERIQISLKTYGYPRERANVRPIRTHPGIFHARLHDAQSIAIWRVSGDSIQWLFVGTIPLEFQTGRTPSSEAEEVEILEEA